MQSKIYGLVQSDFVKGAVVAIVSAVLVAVQSAIALGGVSAIDWHSVLNIAIVAGIAYLVKNFFSTSDGAVLGIVGGKTQEVVKV